MKLAKLKLEPGTNGSRVLGGTTAYAIPAGTIIVVKRDKDDPNRWTLWSIEPRRTNTKADTHVF